MITLAVIGFGYWGPNLVRNFASLETCRVKTIVEFQPARLASARKLYPQIQATASVEDVWRDAEIDAVVLAVPVAWHYSFAKTALQHGKHVLVEKPLTANSAEARELCDLAQQQQRCLMVDHTFLYTGAVKKMKRLIDDGTLGVMQYFDSVRINLGLFQQDINVLWDLAPHDIAILNYLLPEPVQSVVATGISHTPNRIENIAYLTLFYQSNLIAHVSVSWTSPVKIRKILLGGTQKMLMYDDLEPTEKIRLYDTGYQVASAEEKNTMLVDYRIGDIMIPKIEMTEALRGMAHDFVQAIQHGTPPLADAASGAAVVRILEAAEQSIKQRGREVTLA